MKCSKCGSEPQETDKLAWKCTSCGKAYSVKLSYLQKLQEKKNSSGAASLLKCKECGEALDNGNEKIFWKCSCGNVNCGGVGEYNEKKVSKNTESDSINVKKEGNHESGIQKVEKNQDNDTVIRQIKLAIIFSVIPTLYLILCGIYWMLIIGTVISLLADAIIVLIYGVLFVLPCGLLYKFYKDKNIDGLSILWKFTLVWNICLIVLIILWMKNYIPHYDTDTIGGGIKVILLMVLYGMAFGSSVMCTVYSYKITKDKVFISQANRNVIGDEIINEALLIQKYKELLDLGIITLEEFELKKRELL